MWQRVKRGVIMDFENQIEKIVKDIRDREDREMALAFTNVVGSLLRENGVVVKTSRYEFETHNETHNETDKNEYIIKKEYRVSFDGLDFTEHDKLFDDKISKLEKQIERLMREKQFAYDRSEQLMKTADIQNSANEELKQRIAELENKETVELPFDPLETANMLINATYKRKVKGMDRLHCCEGYKLETDMYSINDLEQIAEHLLVYCKHNKESEE